MIDKRLAWTYSGYGSSITKMDVYYVRVPGNEKLRRTTNLDTIGYNNV